MKLSVKVKNLRVTRNYTQADVATAVGVTVSAVSSWETGEKTPRMRTIQKLADLFGVRKSDIIEDDIDLTLYPANVLQIKKKRIPLLGTIAAGVPIYAEEENEEYVAVDDDTRVDFALRVQGDSMIGAEIHDGDIVFIRKQENVDDGQIAAVLIDDEATLKRVYHEHDHVTLVAENPKYAPMVFGADNEVRILGLAVICQSKVI